jgi:hypothetical protein
MLKCLNVKMNKGFTLMEAIVAIFVITTGLVGVLSLVSQTISASTFSKDKLIAAYLAQEGIEIVRNIRDTNWLQSLSWNNGLGAGEYEAAYQDSSLTSCPSICDYDHNLRFLKIDGGFYGYPLSGTETKFKRKITIGAGPIADSMNVKVEVFWQEKGVQHKVEAQENLYNWK